MRTNVPEKLLAIVDEIDTKGNSNLTRLTVLKKWFNEIVRFMFLVEARDEDKLCLKLSDSML